MKIPNNFEGWVFVKDLSSKTPYLCYVEDDDGAFLYKDKVYTRYWYYDEKTDMYKDIWAAFTIVDLKENFD